MPPLQGRAAPSLYCQEHPAYACFCFWLKDKNETRTFGRMCQDVKAENVNGREKSLKGAWGKVNGQRMRSLWD